MCNRQFLSEMSNQMSYYLTLYYNFENFHFIIEISIFENFQNYRRKFGSFDWKFYTKKILKIIEKGAIEKANFCKS